MKEGRTKIAHFTIHLPVYSRQAMIFSSWLHLVNVLFFTKIQILLVFLKFWTITYWFPTMGCKDSDIFSLPQLYIHIHICSVQLSNSFTVILISLLFSIYYFFLIWLFIFTEINICILFFLCLFTVSNTPISWLLSWQYLFWIPLSCILVWRFEPTTA